MTQAYRGPGSTTPASYCFKRKESVGDEWHHRNRSYQLGELQS